MPLEGVESFSLDVTGFYNDYDRLVSTESTGPPGFVPFPVPHLEIRQRLENLTRGSDPADAKSLVQVFKAAVAQDHEIRLTIDGADEEQAVSELVGLIESNFGE